MLSRGWITKKRQRAKATVDRKAHAAEFMSDALAILIARMRRHHARASFRAAAPIVMDPGFVYIRPPSFNSLARTGKAVMDIATPMKT